MPSYLKYLYFGSFSLLLMGACNTAKKKAADIQIEFGAKPTIIYKTKNDYRDKVPVTLSEDKSSIVAYPAPKDVLKGDEPALPVALEDGFLLDQRGVGPNTAFLNMTYTAYAKLEQVPVPDSLYLMIQEPSPIVECYNCGNIREVEKLNILIKGKALSKCKKLN